MVGKVGTGDGICYTWLDAGELGVFMNLASLFGSRDTVLFQFLSLMLL
jgi:hypothetical protein